jgi:hypothetical protein
MVVVHVDDSCFGPDLACYLMHVRRGRQASPEIDVLAGVCPPPGMRFAFAGLLFLAKLESGYADIRQR